MKYDYQKSENETITTKVIKDNDTLTEETTVIKNKMVKHSFRFSIKSILEWLGKWITLFTM